MGDATGTFDKVALGDQVLFNMKHNEKHLDRLYELFPDNRDDIDNFMRISDKLLLATPIYLASKLFPLWLQRVCEEGRRGELVKAPRNTHTLDSLG